MRGPVHRLDSISSVFTCSPSPFFFFQLAISAFVSVFCAHCMRRTYMSIMMLMPIGLKWKCSCLRQTNSAQRWNNKKKFSEQNDQTSQMTSQPFQSQYECNYGYPLVVCYYFSDRVNSSPKANTALSASSKFDQHILKWRFYIHLHRWCSVGQRFLNFSVSIYRSPDRIFKLYERWYSWSNNNLAAVQ